MLLLTSLFEDIVAILTASKKMLTRGAFFALGSPDGWILILNFLLFRGAEATDGPLYTILPIRLLIQLKQDDKHVLAKPASNGNSS